jgi:hypothetical protein
MISSDFTAKYPISLIVDGIFCFLYSSVPLHAFMSGNTFKTLSFTTFGNIMTLRLIIAAISFNHHHLSAEIKRKPFFFLFLCFCS